MFFKKLWNRMVELLSDKSSGIQPEFRQQLADIAKRIEELLQDNHGECEIPDELLKEIARCLLPDIIKFFESDNGKKEFEKWRNESISIKKLLKMLTIWNNIFFKFDMLECDN